jgi:fructose-1-phosphate kinase PfkB-like protein
MQEILFYITSAPKENEMKKKKQKTTTYFKGSSPLIRFTAAEQFVKNLKAKANQQASC